MPIREYQCPVCGYIREELIMPGDFYTLEYHQTLFCLRCQKENWQMVEMNRIISSGHFRVKGGAEGDNLR